MLKTEQDSNDIVRLSRRQWMGAALVGGALPLLSSQARAAEKQGFPSSPVHLVVPFAAGGATDVLGRILAKSMEGTFGQSVIVENRVGAAGVIAASYVANAPPDGLVALFGGVGTNALLEYTQPTLPYKPARDFVDAGNFCYVDFVMAVSANSRYQSLAELLEDAKARPGKVSYMSAGPMGTLHIAQEYLWKRAGVTMNHIPYKGEAHVVPDLVAGRVDLALMTLSLSRQLVQEGKLRMLATLAPERLRGAPQLPTVAELGFPNFAMPTWNGVFLPSQTPAAVVRVFNEAINTALRDPAVLKRIEDMGISPSEQNTPAQHAQFMEKERRRWRTMVAESGVKIE